MLSAAAGLDSCQRISADSSNANSVNFPNKAGCAAIIFEGRGCQKNGVIKMKLPLAPGDETGRAALGEDSAALCRGAATVEEIKLARRALGEG